MAQEEDVVVPVSNETLIVISITGFTLIVTTLYILFFRGKSGIGDSSSGANIGRAENRAQRKARQREERRLERIRQQEAELLEAAEARMDEAAQNADDGDNDDDNNSLHSYDLEEDNDDDNDTMAGDESTGDAGHIGRNRRLEQKRADKRARKEELRRMEAQRREELQAKRQAEDGAYAEWLRQKRVDDAIEREEFQREQAKKERNRLEKLRHMREDDVNSVYEQLTDEIAVDMAAFIIRCKVVKLQDLLIKFRVRYTDITKHISKLENHAEGGTMLLCSRDAIMYVNREEMIAVSDYIKGAGRTTFSELASVCNDNGLIDCKSTLLQVDDDEHREEEPSIRNALQIS